MMQTLRKILIPVGIGFTILALIGLLGSALMLYREAAAVHPILGWFVILLLLVGVGLLIVYPVAKLLMLPASLVRPEKTSGRKWEKFLQRYAGRILKNGAVRNEYEGLAALEATFNATRGEKKRQGAGSGAEAVSSVMRVSQLEDEINNTLTFLDRRTEKIIRRHAAAVFAATAVSQSGRLDTAIVLSAQLRMVKEIAEVYYQRPHPRELWALYLNVGTAAFIAGEIQDSEVLAVLGAPVSAGLSGLIPVNGMDPLISLLVNSLLDGSANALLTLRIGVLARRYCGIRIDADRRALTRSASLEAAGLLGGVVAEGASRVAAATRRLVVGGAVRFPQKAAMGVVGAVGVGGHLLAGIAKLAGKAAGTAAKKVSEPPVFAVKQMIRFWEHIEEVFEPETERVPGPHSDGPVD
ncbi:MAG: YcjF family protein [Candidatus Eisenbacteria bacterium]|uniref:YcjF family protein n=1 Tax=Eiseniibacteriota bacterium TaxID=2212470 RepID=A0A948WCB6_UNCEI|nr:YcjF family protein [Candidatus Eisenbacteria bacterium]MBU1950458.1 YcjF family protein [Candidatus Eisenbacteria bacterium]MBU2690773.1 YcjF family protein [Candidatus Eisenbacteria bacterium]